MLSPNYYSGWNYAVNEMSADELTRKSFVRSLGAYEATIKYSSYGQDYWQGLTDAVATYQNNRKIPLKAEVKFESFFNQTI